MAEVTVTVNLVVELDGEPISRMLEVPATFHEDPKGAGLTINMHIDGRKLAEALRPHLEAQRPAAATVWPTVSISCCAMCGHNHVSGDPCVSPPYTYRISGE